MPPQGAVHAGGQHASGGHGACAAGSSGKRTARQRGSLPQQGRRACAAPGALQGAALPSRPPSFAPCSSQCSPPPPPSSCPPAAPAGQEGHGHCAALGQPSASGQPLVAGARRQGSTRRVLHPEQPRARRARTATAGHMAGLFAAAPAHAACCRGTHRCLLADRLLQLLRQRLAGAHVVLPVKRQQRRLGINRRLIGLHRRGGCGAGIRAS